MRLAQAERGGQSYFISRALKQGLDCIFKTGYRHLAPMLGLARGQYRTLYNPGLDIFDYACNLPAITDVITTMQISEAESLVMQVLWQRSPRYAEDIIAQLCEEQDWQEPTIKTLLNRLLNKGAIQAEKHGRRYNYSAVLKREEWVTSESKSLLNRIFDGRVAPLVAHFSEKGKLSKKDIAELKKLIEGLDDER